MTTCHNRLLYSAGTPIKRVTRASVFDLSRVFVVNGYPLCNTFSAQQATRWPFYTCQRAQPIVCVDAMNEDTLRAIVRDETRAIVRDELKPVNARLDGIEKKLDKATDHIIGLARTTNKRFDKIEGALRDHGIEVPA